MYRPSTTFELISNFDVTNDFETTDPYLQLTTTDEPGEVFEGNRSLKLKLDDLNPNFAIRTFDNFDLPRNGDPIYVEMHYKNEAAFTVGIAANNPDGTEFNVQLLNIGPQTEWKKIYLPIATAVGGSTANDFFLNITGAKPDSLDTATYLWDNIKVLHN